MRPLQSCLEVGAVLLGARTFRSAVHVSWIGLVCPPSQRWSRHNPTDTAERRAGPKGSLPHDQGNDSS
eukprot:206716-Alexandrium_andersonii.AAC.1